MCKKISNLRVAYCSLKSCAVLKIKRFFAKVVALSQLDRRLVVFDLRLIVALLLQFHRDEYIALPTRCLALLD